MIFFPYHLGTSYVGLTAGIGATGFDLDLLLALFSAILDFLVFWFFDHLIVGFSSDQRAREYNIFAL